MNKIKSIVVASLGLTICWRRATLVTYAVLRGTFTRRI